MKNVALIGLGQFNIELLAELYRIGHVRISIVDREDELVEQYKDRSHRAFIADVTGEETMQRVIGNDTDVAVIDLGAAAPATILAVNHLKKLGVPRIVARADTDEFARVLKALGVHEVVMPGLDAAQRIGPPLLLSGMTDFLPISDELVLAEVVVPAALAGGTIVSSSVRARFRVNIVAMRRSVDEEYSFPDIRYRFTPTDLVLVAGTERDIAAFAGMEGETGPARVSLLGRVLRGRGTGERKAPARGTRRKPENQRPGDAPK